MNDLCTAQNGLDMASFGFDVDTEKFQFSPTPFTLPWNAFFNLKMNQTGAISNV